MIVVLVNELVSLNVGFIFYNILLLSLVFEMEFLFFISDVIIIVIIFVSCYGDYFIFIKIELLILLLLLYYSFILSVVFLFKKYFILR